MNTFALGLRRQHRYSPITEHREQPSLEGISTSKVMVAADSSCQDRLPDPLFDSPNLFHELWVYMINTIITLAMCRDSISHSPTLPAVDKSRSCK